MSSLFSREKKQTTLTIETGPELRGLFDSKTVPVDTNKVVRELIVFILASYQSVETFNDTEYGLYTKDGQMLESLKTLKENRVKSKVWGWR